MQMKKHEIADATGLQGIYISVVNWRNTVLVDDTSWYTKVLDTFVDADERQRLVAIKSLIKKAVKDED